MTKKFELNTIIDGTTIRRTQDGRISVFDALKASGAASPRETWKRLSSTYPDIVTKCDNTRFPGRGGAAKATPVTDAEGWRAILTVLPGLIGKQYRAAANELVTKFLEQPELVAAAAIDRVQNPADLKRLEARARSKRNAINLSGTVLAAGASQKALARVHDINNVTITGKTAQERTVETGLKLHRDAFTPAQLSAMDLLQTVEAQQIQDCKLHGDGEVIAKTLEVTRDAEPFLRKYLGSRSQPHGGMLQVESGGTQ